MSGNFNSSVILRNSACTHCSIPLLVNQKEWRVSDAHICAVCSYKLNNSSMGDDELEKALDEIYGNEELLWEDLDLDGWEITGDDIPQELAKAKSEPKCDCGAKYTEFPDLHYKWCELSQGKSNV